MPLSWLCHFNDSVSELADKMARNHGGNSEFGHYHYSMKTCHDNDSTKYIIRSSVSKFCIRKIIMHIQYVGAPCYIKELPKSKVGTISPIG